MTILKILLALLSIPVVLLAAAVWMQRGELRKMERLCAAAAPGTPVASLKALFQSHGVEPKWADLAPAGEDGLFDAYAPMMTTMGEDGCHIFHDGQSVMAASIDPNEPKTLAVRYAFGKLRTLERWKRWKKEGKHYELQDLSWNPENGKASVTFDLKMVTDQSVRMLVDVRQGMVESVHEHME